MSFKFEDPKEWFLFELDKATRAGVAEPTAMLLATADKLGNPDLRTVLFKGWRHSGLSFFTNYNSPKARNLIENPKASLCFFWANLNQQIRISGIVEKLSFAESQDYFWSRPRISQIGAWASDQSQPIRNYEEFDSKVKQTELRFKDTPKIPCPPHWGGFVLTPVKYEFWYGVEGRLHERYLFTQIHDSGTWQKTMLSP